MTIESLGGQVTASWYDMEKYITLNIVVWQPLGKCIIGAKFFLKMLFLVLIRMK